MASIPVTLPEMHKSEGCIYFIGTLTVKAGKGDEAAALLAKVKAHADSDAEPECLQYVVLRNGFDPIQFSVFEKYNLPKGPEDHFASAPLRDFMAAGLVTGLDVKFYDEVPAA